MSRFLAKLGEEPHLTHLRAIFDVMAKRLGLVVGDLGRDTAGDSTGLSGRAALSEKLRAAEMEQGLPQPTGGKKEYKDDDGKVTHAVEWFGFKLHLLVDVRHEVALAYHITDTKAGDNERIPELVEQAKHNLPDHRIKTLAYDKAADDSAVHEFLHDEEIAPIIHNRKYQLEEPEKVVGGRTPLNIVYDQAGTVFCYDKVSETPIRHQMAYIGHEPDRGTLKYRCPARHHGFECPSDAACNGDRDYGLTVRVKQEIDLRRFPIIPRATKQFERLYKGRTAIERVNARLKIFWGIDDGQVYGSRRFHGHVGAVMVVHLAFATLLAQTARYEGTYGKMKLSPIAEALRALLQKSPTAAEEPAQC
jgi:Transposase DDE domain